MLKNSNKILISPSVIASDLSRIGESVKQYDRDIIDLLHVDVMDGNFVSNLTIGPGYINNLKNNTTIPLDVHLMINKPENSIEQYLEIVPWGITIHYESTKFPARILKTIHDTGIIAGLAINPATAVDAVFDLLPYADMVLIMSVEPGYYGQSFMEIAIKRIKKLADFITKEGYGKILIQVDGGINKKNISSVVQAGANVIVAGSSAFKDDDLNSNVLVLKKHTE